MYSALKESRETEDSTEGMESGIDLRECDCTTVLSKLYPQMVHHWRAAGNIGKTLHYLMEAAGACIAAFNDMRVGLYCSIIVQK